MQRLVRFLIIMEKIKITETLNLNLGNRDGDVKIAKSNSGTYYMVIESCTSCGLPEFEGFEGEEKTAHIVISDDAYSILSNAELNRQTKSL